MIRRPKQFAGYRAGRPYYAHSIEWPFAYFTIIALVAIGLVADRYPHFLRTITNNQKALADTGAFFLLTIGGLAFKDFREKRWLRVVCMSLGAAGFVLSCVFNWKG